MTIVGLNIFRYIRDMKNAIISIVMFLIGITSANAAESHVVELVISDGASSISPSAKRAMEENAVKLLTMMSDAQAAESKTLNFKGIPITPGAKTTILQMWKHMPLRIWEDDGVAPLISQNLLRIQGVNSFQIRNIPVRLFPADKPGNSKYSEVAINFTANGTIEDFNITIEKNQYDRLVGGAITVQDVENRKMLAFWMDQLKMAYESHDLERLKTMFDKDAVIITGVRTNRKASHNPEFKSLETFEYYVKNYEQYMASLKRVFRNNKRIVVNFKDQEYGMNELYTVKDENGEDAPRYYMVWCTQEWTGTTYSDTGRLFILWDFKKPDEPVIMVRAWTHPNDPKQFSDQDFNLTAF